MKNILLATLACALLCACDLLGGNQAAEIEWSKSHADANRAIAERHLMHAAAKAEPVEFPSRLEMRALENENAQLRDTLRRAGF